jgi:cyclophilin family peptidyl-prolyl cis-trans isomerase
LRELRVAEFNRDATKLSLTDVTSRSVEHRRAATRVLARIGAVQSRELLTHALHDAEREVVAWAAFGLGRECGDNDARETTLALVTRAGTLSLDPSTNHAELEPFYAIAVALGRCATDEAESVLRSWLTISRERARDAALGLTVLATNKKHLDAQTIVALLGAAERYRGFAIGILPLTRLYEVESTVGRRLLSLAPSLLESSGDERRFLIRALEHTGDSGLLLLERIVKDNAQYRAAERAEAIRVIAKLGQTGQSSLGRLLPRVVRPDQDPSEAWFLGADFAVLFELLGQLERVEPFSRDFIGKLARFESGHVDSKAMSLRLDWLRCHAAALSAGSDPNDPLLASCAVTEGSREAKLAILRVLSRCTLRGKALYKFDALLEDPDSTVRIEAVKLLVSHDELRNRDERLTLALSDKSMGVVATAAGILAKRPELALRGERPNAELFDALGRVMTIAWPNDAVELRASLIDAAGALGVLTVKPQVDLACASSVITLRQHAEQALHRLGEPKRRCDVKTKSSNKSFDVALPTSEVTLIFHTDLAPLELRLDPKLAPLAVERLIALATAGFFDGMAVHRVVPGFVVQLGDNAGDGYGVAGKQPLPCELAPIPFAPGDVGMALSGLDSGSSQFFVTLGPYPQLGNDYSRVGRAGSGWDRLTVGDVVRKVEISR